MKGVIFWDAVVLLSFCSLLSAERGEHDQQENVALGKSSIFSAASRNETPDPSFRVVDGDSSNYGDAANQTCLFTPAGLYYVDWTVDLRVEYYIDEILLVFRDSDLSRIRGFNVSVYSGSLDLWTECYHYEPEDQTLQLQFPIECPLNGSKVRVSISRKNTPEPDFSQYAFLDLCEVEVYGVAVCYNGTFGKNCSQHCHCLAGICDVRTGECPDPGHCRDGWYSSSCDKACPKGTYGSKCSQICGHCLNNQTCHHVTGACPGKCTIGYRDPAKGCLEECYNGEYGWDCQETCGQCRDEVPCDPVTGDCPDGCQPGYHGSNCVPLPEAEDLDDGLPTTAVIGAVAAGGAVFLCCVCAVGHFRKKRRKKRNAKYKPDNSISHEAANITNPVAAAIAASAMAERRKSTIFSNRKLSLFSERKKSVVFAGGAERKRSIFAAVFGFAKDEDLSGLPVYNNHLPDPLGSQNLFVQDKNAGVPVDRFRQYVYGKRRGTNSLENEFKSLPSGFTASYEDAERPENKDKNKIPEYYPYDYNRVILKAPGHGDYVNASRIKDYKGRDIYIAAQAPCKKSASDFWHMIWQENIGKIVMLTNFVEYGKSKCDRYWSENGCVTYGHITVKDATQTVRATCIIRSMKLIQKKTAETREVTHFQYTEWAEYSIPLVHDLLEFIWRVKAAPTKLSGPLLVHCSNGSGRTGTFIAVESLLQQAEDSGRLDVKTYVELLRHQRKSMVLTKEQYAFLHAALIDGIILGDTRINAAKFYQDFEREGDQLRIGYRQICEQFQAVSSLRHAHHILERAIGERKLETTSKNLYESILDLTDLTE